MSGNQQPTIIGLNIALIILTSAALSSRVGRRVVVSGTWTSHDILITVAAFSAFVFSICQIVGTKFGLGQHADAVSDTELPKLVKLIMASNVFYFGCNWAVKHALLVFYSELVRDNRVYQYSIYFMHFVAFGFGFSSILVNIFQCRPIHKAWDSKTPGWCANMNIFFYCNGSIMLATDIVLYAMPVVFTRGLQLRRPQRIGLNFLFALGGLVLAASAARVYAVNGYATHNDDFPWWFANAMIYSVVENHLAIVVACAPSIKVIALLLFPRLVSSYKNLRSRVTPSSSRSRSRSVGINDLESGTRKTDYSGKSGRSGKSDKSGKVRGTPIGSPLPSPAFTAGSGASRASRGFSKWFKGPASPRRLSSTDSMDHGLVYTEDTEGSRADVQLGDIKKGAENNDSATKSPDGLGVGNSDIHVQREVTVESIRESSEEDVRVLGSSVRAGI